MTFRRQKADWIVFDLTVQVFLVFKCYRVSRYKMFTSVTSGFPGGFTVAVWFSGGNAALVKYFFKLYVGRGFTINMVFCMMVFIFSINLKYYVFLNIMCFLNFDFDLRIKRQNTHFYPVFNFS